MAPVLYAVVSAALLAVAVIDLVTGMIPDTLVMVIALCGIARALLPAPSLQGLFLAGFGLLAGGGLFLAILLAGRWALKRDAMGWGDVKLMAAAGLLLGWKRVLLATALAALIGGVVVLAGLVTRRLKKEDEVPFGPMLAAGCLAALYFGEAILVWYSHAT